MKMKKIVLFLSLMMSMLMVAPAQAQVRMGLTGGVSMNKVELNGDISQIARNYTGWYVGPTLELGVPVLPLKFDASVMYAYNGAKIGNEKINGSYISVPVNVKYMIGFSSLAAFYLSAGPQFDFNVGDKDFKLNDTTQFALKNSQLSVNLGAGIRALSRVQVGVYYNIACGDAATASAKSVGFKNNMWKANVLVFF